MNLILFMTLVEDESIGISGKNSISFDFVNHMCQPFYLENYLLHRFHSGLYI